MANECILKEVWFLSSGTLRHLQENYNPQKASSSLSKLQKIKVWWANFKLKNLLVKVSQKQSIWVVIFKLDVKGQFKPKKRKSKFYFLKGAVHCGLGRLWGCQHRHHKSEGTMSKFSLKVEIIFKLHFDITKVQLFMHHNYFEWAPCIETFAFFSKCDTTKLFY